MYYQNQFSEEQRSFMWWKKRQRKKYLESALMILFLEILVGTVFLCGQTETIELKDQIFGITGLGTFGAVAIYLLIQWRKSTQWEMKWYEWGIVKEKPDIIHRMRSEDMTRKDITSKRRRVKELWKENVSLKHIRKQKRRKSPFI